MDLEIEILPVVVVVVLVDKDMQTNDAVAFFRN